MTGETARQAGDGRPAAWQVIETRRDARDEGKCVVCHNPEVEGSDPSPYQGRMPFLEQRKGIPHVVRELNCHGAVSVL